MPVKGAADLGDLDAHLAVIERQLGRPLELAGAPVSGVECPEPLAYLWGWFCELMARRGTNGFGVNPIGFDELDAWCRVLGRTLTPWEVRVLLRLDDTALAIMREAKS